MRDFLFYVGVYNLLGALVLLPMLHEKAADFVLRKATEILGEPYRHGTMGKAWILWCATTNTFMGAVMLGCLSWGPEAMRFVTVGVVAVYAAMTVFALAAVRSEAKGRGLYVTHLLWLGQLGWGGYALFVG